MPNALVAEITNALHGPHFPVVDPLKPPWDGLTLVQEFLQPDDAAHSCTQHGPSGYPPKPGSGKYPATPGDYKPFLRALLLAMRVSLALR